MSSDDKEPLGEQERRLVPLYGKINTYRLNCICPFPNGGTQFHFLSALFVASPQRLFRDHSFPFEAPEDKVGDMVPKQALLVVVADTADSEMAIDQILLLLLLLLLDIG